LIVKRSVTVLITAVLLTGVASLASAELKIGVVSIPRLSSESQQAKTANDALTAEFAPRLKTIQTRQQTLKSQEDKLNKDAATMTDVQRSAAEKDLRDGYRDLQMQQSAFQDDLNARKQDELEKIQRVVLEEVAAFAKAQGYDLILSDGVLYATGALDVTNSILQGMQSHKAVAAPATAPGAAPAPANKPPASIAKP
jgi:outer membrane protein